MKRIDRKRYLRILTRKSLLKTIEMKGSIYCSALASISTSSNWNNCLKGSFDWQFYESHLWHVLLGHIRGRSTAGIVISMGIRVLEPVVPIHGLVVFPLLDNQKYFNFLETENFTSCNTLTLSEPMLWTSPRIWNNSSSRLLWLCPGLTW